jgi:uncharacterized membrane protein YphA (DoxX/SURF4 family)
MNASVNKLESYAPTILRIVTGITFALHGWAKLGNPAGFAGFVGSLGFPAPTTVAWLVILLEFVGGLLLIVGFGTRWLGVLFAIEMLVTTMMVKSRIGFIAAQGQPGVGFELDLMLLAAGLTLAILGSGQLSVETNLLRKGSAQWKEARQGVRSPTD